jgi:hypothetical protein
MRIHDRKPEAFRRAEFCLNRSARQELLASVSRITVGLLRRQVGG